MSQHVAVFFESAEASAGIRKKGGKKRKTKHRSTCLSLRSLPTLGASGQGSPKEEPRLTTGVPLLVSQVPGRATTSGSEVHRSRRCVLKLDPISNPVPDTVGQLPRLRVAIFNVFSRVLPHPAASCCKVALTNTPWFFSKAVSRFLCTSTARMHNGQWLSMLAPVRVELLQVEDIWEGRLRRTPGPFSSGFDVLLVPGGSAKADWRTLGPEGCEAIRRFVRSGGGYCGVCAGAFLAHRLRLLDVMKKSRTQQPPAQGDRDEPSDGESGDEFDEPQEAPKAKASRDPFLVNVRFTKRGKKLLWTEGAGPASGEDELRNGFVRMRYHNGPLLGVPKASPAEALCSMTTSEEAPATAPQSLNGCAGVVMQNYGGGRVLAISPHPESTQDGLLLPEPGKESLRRVLQRAVLLAASGPAAHSWLEAEVHIPAKR